MIRVWYLIAYVCEFVYRLVLPSSKVLEISQLMSKFQDKTVKCGNSTTQSFRVI